MPERDSTDWWASYFDEDFVDLYGPLLRPEQSRGEAEAVVEILGLEPGDRLLDLACGWGRHSLELARSGLQVTGLDRSRDLLDLARESARAAGLDVRWVRGDMRRLPFHSSFAAVVSLFSSLGYFGTSDDDLQVLRGVREALRPGGLFLLEVMHRDQVAREFVERDWWEGAGGEHVWVEREFDAVEGISSEWLRWRGGGRSGEKHHRIRIRSATEWAGLLRAAGLTPEEWFGDWDLSAFEHTSERLLVLSRRSR